MSVTMDDFFKDLEYDATELHTVGEAAEWAGRQSYNGQNMHFCITHARVGTEDNQTLLNFSLGFYTYSFGWLWPRVYVAEKELLREGGYPVTRIWWSMYAVFSTEYYSRCITAEAFDTTGTEGI